MAPGARAGETEFGIAPYGGEYAEIVPHLTIGVRGHGSLVELRAAAELAAPLLPLGFWASEVGLFVGGPAGWFEYRRSPLARDVGAEFARNPRSPGYLAPSARPAPRW